MERENPAAVDVCDSDLTGRRTRSSQVDNQPVATEGISTFALHQAHLLVRGEAKVVLS